MNAAWDIADVQDWLGHRHVSSTMIYAQVTNQFAMQSYDRSRRTGRRGNAPRRGQSPAA